MRISFRLFRVFLTQLFVYGWSGISTLCVFSRTSLLTVQSLPSWGMSEGRGGKGCSSKYVTPGRAGAVGMKDSMVLPAPLPASEKRFGFKREFYSFNFILVGWLVCFQINLLQIPRLGKYEAQPHWG